MSVESLPVQAPPDLLRLIGEGLHRLINHAQRQRSRVNATAQGQFEWSAGRLVGTLVRQGPMRMTELASVLDTDLSNVSRHVSTLVDNQLIARHQDPEDRRACVLAATELAVAKHEDRMRDQSANLDRVLEQWSAHDRAELARLLTRFSKDFEKHEVTPPALGLLKHHPASATTGSTEQKAK